MWVFQTHRLDERQACDTHDELAAPNVENTASFRMQEAVGGVRIGEEVATFPESMENYTTPVRHYIYRATREVWNSAGGRGPEVPF